MDEMQEIELWCDSEEYNQYLDWLEETMGPQEMPEDYRIESN